MEGFSGCLILKFREQAHQRSPIWNPQLQCIQLLLLSRTIQHDVVLGSLLFQDARHFCRVWLPALRAALTNVTPTAVDQRLLLR